MNLTVCTVNFNTAKYIAFQDFTFRRLAREKAFRRVVCNVTPGGAELEFLKNLPHTTAYNVDLAGVTGSMSHGMGLNTLLERVETEYACIADPDTAALAPQWDEICQRELTGDCVAIGKPYPRTSPERYQNFPMVIFLYFKVDAFRKMQIDFRPEPFWLRKIKARLRRLAKLEDRDTGWRLPVKFKEHGFTAKAFEHVTPQDSHAVVLDKNSRGEEGHWNGKPILTHQGRSGAGRGFDESEISKKWLDGICRYLELPRELPSEVTHRFMTAGQP